MKSPSSFNPNMWDKPAYLNAFYSALAQQPQPAQCVCMQAWNSVTGRTCPVHGYCAPMNITC